MQGMTLKQARETRDFLSQWTKPTLIPLPDGSWEVQAKVEQPEARRRLAEAFPEPAPQCRQRVLLTGMDCLAGQLDLFDT